MAVEKCVKPVGAALKALDSSEAKQLAKSTKSHLHQKKSLATYRRVNTRT